MSRAASDACIAAIVVLAACRPSAERVPIPTEASPVVEEAAPPTQPPPDAGRHEASAHAVVRTISAGAFRTCATTSEGALLCWGVDATSAGEPPHHVVAAEVEGVDSDIAEVSCGLEHSCVVTTRHTAECWGGNSFGALGDGSRTDRLVPVPVTALGSDVASLSAGSSHSCAITSAGAVLCWGSLFTQASLVPEMAAGLSSGVVAVATGQEHACVLTTGGGVKCWGAGDKGQLGDGAPIRDPDDEHSPVHGSALAVDVRGLPSGIVSISAGADHTCALTAKGSVVCWGQGTLGQLGNGTKRSSSVPVAVQALSGVRSISAGSVHTCAVTAAGSVRCWGANAEGQLGNGTTRDRSVPVSVIGLSSGAIAVAAGDNHTCALTSRGKVKCWGDNSYGQLGNGSTESSLVPVDVLRP